MRIVDFVCRPDARHRLVLGLFAGVVVFLISRGYLWSATAAIAGWNAFAVVVLALDWVTILTTPLRKIRELAQQQDLSRFLIFLFVVVTACAALFAVGFLVSVKKNQTDPHFIIHLLLVLMTVLFSWTLVHTEYGLRYTH